MFLDLTIVDGCLAIMGAVLTAAFDGPEEEICEAAVLVTEGATWGGVE